MIPVETPRKKFPNGLYRSEMDIEHIAFERLKLASEMSLTYYEKPLVLTYSGGKDSEVCLTLTLRSGIPFEVVHNHTTADAPQTVRFVRERFKQLESQGISCSIDYPNYKHNRISLWSLIPQKLIPPTRLQRYCCSVLKESSCRNRLIVTGVRWSESSKRLNSRGIYESIASDSDQSIILNNDNNNSRRIFENCALKAKRVCNPIVDWSHESTWDYIKSEHLPKNPLYCMGFNRVGCIGCPLAGDKRRFEFQVFPAYENLYRHSFQRLILARKAAGKKDTKQWTTVDGLFSWWMEDDK